MRLALRRRCRFRGKARWDRLISAPTRHDNLSCMKHRLTGHSGTPPRPLLLTSPSQWLPSSSPSSNASYLPYPFLLSPLFVSPTPRDAIRPRPTPANPHSPLPSFPIQSAQLSKSLPNKRAPECRPRNFRKSNWMGATLVAMIGSPAEVWLYHRKLLLSDGENLGPWLVTSVGILQKFGNTAWVLESGQNLENIVFAVCEFVIPVISCSFLNLRQGTLWKYCLGYDELFGG